MHASADIHATKSDVVCQLVHSTIPRAVNCDSSLTTNCLRHCANFWHLSMAWHFWSSCPANSFVAQCCIIFDVGESCLGGMHWTQYNVYCSPVPASCAPGSGQIPRTGPDDFLSHVFQMDYIFCCAFETLHGACQTSSLHHHKRVQGKLRSQKGSCKPHEIH